MTGHRARYRHLPAYGAAIDAGDYHHAWRQLSPGERRSNRFGQLAANESSTTIPDWTLHGLHTGPRPGTYVAYVVFRSYQSPADAPGHRGSCDTWRLDHTMAARGGLWLISKAAARPGAPAGVRCG